MPISENDWTSYFGHEARLPNAPDVLRHVPLIRQPKQHRWSWPQRRSMYAPASETAGSDPDYGAELKGEGVGIPSKFSHFAPPSNIREKPIHHPNMYGGAFLGPRIFPQPRPGIFGASPLNPGISVPTEIQNPYSQSISGWRGMRGTQSGSEPIKQFALGKSLGSMEQYRLEPIEMTDLGQSAEWAQEMQKAVEEDKQHEHHTANAAGMGGGAAPEWGGHHRGGGRGVGADADTDTSGVVDSSGVSTLGRGAALPANQASRLGFSPQDRMVTIKSPSGASFQVNKGAAAQFSGFLKDLEATGYRVRSSGGYAYRNIRGSGRLSQHAYGTAIDIDAEHNPLGSSRTNLPAGTADLARKWGLSWGAQWRGRKDPMHFEISRRLQPGSKRFSGGDAGVDGDRSSGAAAQDTEAATSRRQRQRNFFHHPAHRVSAPAQNSERPAERHHFARQHRTPSPHHAHPHPKRFPLPARPRRTEMSGTATPPSRSFAGVQGMAGSPSGPALERPNRA